MNYREIYLLRFLHKDRRDDSGETKVSRPSPHPLQICKKNSLSLDEILGVKYNVISGDWNLSNDDNVNYMARFRKI